MGSLMLGICLFTDVNTPVGLPPMCSHIVAEFSVTHPGPLNGHVLCGRQGKDN